MGKIRRQLEKINPFQTALERGWAMVPVSGKGPYQRNWSARTEPPTDKELRTWLASKRTTGLGVVLGASGLVDIDCDCEEARTLAPALLPFTECVWGRESNPHSHFVYRCEGKTVKLSDEKNSMLLEVRTGRHQTVVPGSTHPSGELIEFVETLDSEPSEVDFHELLTAARAVAFASMLVRELGDHGKHNLLLPAYGGLVKCGWTIDRVVLLDEAFVETGYTNIDREDQIRRTLDRDTDHKQNQGWGYLNIAIGEAKTRKLKSFAGQVGKSDVSNTSLSLGDRVPVDLTDGNVAADVEAIVTGLQERGGVFTRDGQLVRIVGAAIDPHDTASLKLAISERISTRKFSQKEGMWKSINATEDTAKIVLRKGTWELPPLNAVSKVPVLRWDGTVGFSTGYDEPTGVFISNEVADAPTVGETRDDAIRSVEALLSLVSDTPFENETDEVSWIAGVITECVRGSLLPGQAVPGFFVNANDQGAGKTTLAKIAICAGTGNWPSNANVLVKERGGLVLDPRSMTSLMRGGLPILLDNVDGKLECPTLAASLTDGHYTGKPLYSKATISFRLPTAVWVTTNGGTIGPDLVRRLLPIRLLVTAGRGKDIKRGRKIKPLMQETWREVHCHALTIVRAYLLAGAPEQDHGWSDHAEWANLVLGALVWLLPNVVAFGKVQDDMGTFDDNTEETEGVIEALRVACETWDGGRISQTQIADDGYPDETTALGKLQLAIRRVAGLPQTAPLSSRRVGQVLRKSGAPLNGWRIHQIRAKNRPIWTVVESS